MRLAKRGVIAAFFIRLVSVAPFALVNMIAGGSQLRFRDFLIGGTLGLVPGTLLEAVFIDSLITAVHTPGPRAVVMVAGSLLLIVVGGLCGKVVAGPTRCVNKAARKLILPGVRGSKKQTALQYFYAGPS